MDFEWLFSVFLGFLLVTSVFAASNPVKSQDGIVESLDVPDEYFEYVDEAISYLGTNVTEVPEINNPYQYIEINLNLPDYIDVDPGDVPANITFTVEKSWLQDIGGDPIDIVLRRYHNSEWSDLDTVVLEETGDYYRFEAHSPGFSFFSIGLRETETTIIVDQDGTEDYTNIQTAIDNSGSGDNIIVNSGEYYENVEINKSITLEGSDTGTGKPVINGTGNGNVVELESGNTTIKNFKITNSGSDVSDSGIKVGSNHNTIQNNTIENNYNGVSCYESSNNIISNNTILENKKGVVVGNSRNNIIRSNNITQNYEAGVVSESSPNTTIQYNNVTQTGGGDVIAGGIRVYKNPSDDLESLNNFVLNNTLSQNSGAGVAIGNVPDYRESNNVTIRGNTFIDDGLIIYEGHDHTIEDNTVNGKPLIYKEDADNQIIGENTNAGEIVLHECENITIKNQNITNTDWAIELYRTNQTTITNNHLQKNYDGIALWSSINNTIQENNITETIRAGIYLQTPSLPESELLRTKNNVIKNNNIIDNDETDYPGIFVDDSRSNTIQDNQIQNNNIGIEIWSRGGHSQPSNNTIQNNNITENSGCGIFLTADTNNNTIQDNQIQNNGEGVSCENGWSNTIQNNTITNNTQYGISLYGGRFQHKTEYNTIQDNQIQNNLRGINLNNAFNNTIKGNNITKFNGYGVVSNEATDNIFYLNNFKNATEANVISDSSDNSWVSPEPMNYNYNGEEYTSRLGNYYDDYSGSDEDGDGVGEIDYTIQNDNNDTYPLIDPAENYSTQDQPETPGDLNGDGDVSATDLSLTIQLIINDGYDSAADINNDNNVSATDLSLIIQLIIQN